MYILYSIMQVTSGKKWCCSGLSWDMRYCTKWR